MNEDWLAGFPGVIWFHVERDSRSEAGFSGSEFSNMRCRLPQAAILFWLSSYAVG